MATKRKGEVYVPESREGIIDMANKLAFYEQHFKQLENGSRPAYFKRGIDNDRGLVVLNDGSESIARYYNADINLRDTLQAGDMVGVALQGSAIIETHGTLSGHGLVSKLERILPDGRLELNDDGKLHLCWPTAKLANDIKEGKVKAGASIVVKTGPNMAIEAVPEPEGLNQFRYLVQLPPPNVVAERDMGNPPKWLTRLRQFLRRSMLHPKTNARYGLRSLFTMLLKGPAGCGKTMSILAGQREMYQMISELTDEPIESLPFRSLRMKASTIYSMWLGESDKNMDRFFDEMEELSGKPVKIGRKEHKLPVFCTIEEVEAIVRQRGGQDGAGGAMDRIMTTFLQRLDATRPELRDKVIVFICTTNEPHLIDHAAFRRLGGVVEHIGMLDKASFPKVLEKHVARIPIESDNGTPMSSLREMATDYVTATIFTDERPLVELMTSKGAVKKYRKDFMTPALIDRAVQQAAEIAAEMEMNKQADGVPVKVLVDCFESQIQSVAAQLGEGNAHKYLDLGDEERVSKVRRV